MVFVCKQSIGRFTQLKSMCFVAITENVANN